MEINEEIKQKMVEYLQSFEAGMKKAGEFSAEQAPLVVQEFLAWEFWGNAVPAICCLVLLVSALIFVATVWMRTKSSDWRFGSSLAAGSVIALLIMPLSISASNALRVCIAPRIVVLEKISELVR